MVDLKGLGRMDGPLDGILMVCGLFSPWRLDYSFFFLVQVSPFKAISSSLSILLGARLSDKVNLALLPLNDH